MKPAVGNTSLFEWVWTRIPASPVTFSYTLNVPAGTTGTKMLAALVLPRQSGTQFQVLVQPDPLAIDQVTHHAADTNRDFRISLTELLRVIELYNTRYGTVRTGAYVVDANNLEDGFGTDPARSNTAVVTLARYHSGDSNHDAKLSLTELLRVIELYNTRSGTVRTGQYHVQAGTEDGFATGSWTTTPADMKTAKIRIALIFVPLQPGKLDAFRDWANCYLDSYDEAGAAGVRLVHLSSTAGTVVDDRPPRLCRPSVPRYHRIRPVCDGVGGNVRILTTKFVV